MSNALKAFLEDTERGMFHGPYVRTRLPYARAIGWDGILDWMPDWFTPYHHQAEAFRRLRSRGEQGARRPEPTLVITGTGSGKTESFLYPVLDHAAWARAEGQRGTKALLYPMNALANDQADRLAKLLTSEPALAGVTAGIYTGESTGSVRKVTRDSTSFTRTTAPRARKAYARFEGWIKRLPERAARAHLSRRDQCVCEHLDPHCRTHILQWGSLVARCWLLFGLER